MLEKTVFYTESDMRAVASLSDFLPNKIFDAHAHLFSSDFLPSAHAEGEVSIADLETYFENMSVMLSSPGELRINMITFPDPAMADLSSGHLKRSDDFIVEQLSKKDGNVGQIMVIPTESEEDIEKRLVHTSIRGLKCYFTMSAREKHGEESPYEYLPESAWRVADKRGLSITLHLAKERALSASENLSYIMEMAEKYKNATLVLAHSARAFSARTAIESVDYLKKYDNVFFDFSAICESPSIIKILNTVGTSRCMWGSDYPTNTFIGKAISYADKFVWLGKNVLPHAWNLGVENLMAVKEASDIIGLSRSEIENIFYNTAANLWK